MASAQTLLSRRSGWGVYEQGTYKFCFKATVPKDGPLSYMRHARTGERSIRVNTEEQTMWFAIEPYEVVAPNFWLDEAGNPSQNETGTHMHPGTAVYNKPLSHAERDWKPVSDFKRCSELLQQSGRAFPAKMIALTIAEACGSNLSVAEVEKILTEGASSPAVGIEFAFFQSRALILGRILDVEDGTPPLLMMNRREVCMKDDLLVVELSKEHRIDDGTMKVHEPLLIRRIDAPAVRGQLWYKLPVSEETVLKLLDSARELQRESHIDMKVTAQKSAQFYSNAMKRFLIGFEDKDGNKRKPVTTLNISGLGLAINVAVQVSTSAEREGLAVIRQIETSQRDGCAAISITLFRK